MDFRGHLRLPDDAGTGIPVVLRVEDIFVIISAGSEELGAWRADDIEIERIFSNQFAIELAGESMVFVAEDALGFAYEGITAIEELQSRLTKRGVFRRSRKKAKKSDAAAVELGDGEQEESVAAQPAPAPEPSRRPAAELVSHLEHPDEADADAVVPDLQAVPPLPSSSLWTPATAKAAPSAETVEGSESPIPTGSGAESRRPSEERPSDTRVSYPRASTPPPPAVEAFVPPATDDGPAPTDEPHREPDAPVTDVVSAVSATIPEPDTVDPVDESSPEHDPEPERVFESDPELEPVFELDPEPEPVFEPDPEPEPAVELVHQPEPVDEPEAEPFEIEEVTAASTGAPWEEADVQPEVESQPEIEIEDYFPPTAGEVDTYIAPQPDPEPVVTEPEAELVAEVAAEPEEVPESVVEPEPATASFEAGIEDQGREEPPSDAAAAQVAEAADEASTANGHTTEKRRSFLFGRGREKSVPEHDHTYGEPKTIGGLTRQVCSVCGHVTFSGQDVYQDW